MPIAKHFRLYENCLFHFSRLNATIAHIFFAFSDMKNTQQSVAESRVRENEVKKAHTKIFISFLFRYCLLSLRVTTHYCESLLAALGFVILEGTFNKLLLLFLSSSRFIVVNVSKNESFVGGGWRVHFHNVRELSGKHSNEI